MMLKVWSENHQHGHYLEACWKYRIPDPTPGLLNQVYFYTHESFRSTTQNLCPWEYLTCRQGFTKYLYNLCLVMTFWIRVSPFFGYSYWCISSCYPSIDWVAATSETYFSHFYWLHLRSGCENGQVLVMPLSVACRWLTFLLGPHKGRVGNKLSDVCSYKGTSPITRVPTPWPHLNSFISQRLCLEIASLWVVALCMGDMIQSIETDFCALLWSSFEKIDIRFMTKC